ncbi:MAG TPA: hypothetical protein VMB80_14695 [Candidatus Acidoferrum sp.]|nr:hypothetical protein [Candidatus Acidoferrum sp.]
MASLTLAAMMISECHEIVHLSFRSAAKAELASAVACLLAMLFIGDACSDFESPAVRGVRPVSVFQRRPEQFHPMIFPDPLWELPAGGYLFANPAHLPKEGFHAARRLKENEHLSLSIAGHRERVRNRSRRKSRIPRPESDLVVADLNEKFPSDDVKPFVLEVMTMQGRAAFGGPHGIVDAKIAAGILCGDLEVETAAHNR